MAAARALFTVTGSGTFADLAAELTDLSEVQQVRYGTQPAVVLGGPEARLAELDGASVAGFTLTRRRETRVMTRAAAVAAINRMRREKTS